MNGLQTMVERRGGIRHMPGQGKAVQWYVNTKFPHCLNFPSILSFPTQRSDLCYSSMWGLPPRFLPCSTTTAYVERSPEHGRVLIDPGHAFGTEEPVISVINFLRHTSRTIHEKKDVDVRRLNLSQELYDVEYQLQAVKTDTASPTRPPEIMPLSVALHLYLYLVIRNIPIQTRLISALAKRLRAALETQATFWWEAEGDKHIWLLWTLFIGFGATAQRSEKHWFVEKIAQWLNIYMDTDMDSAFDGLHGVLKRVLWTEIWCAKQYSSLLHEAATLRNGID